jgi:hypothetical protein
MGDNGCVTKGTAKRTTRLSVRVPESLKSALEREAVRERRTVADLVIILLEQGLAKRTGKRGPRG